MISYNIKSEVLNLNLNFIFYFILFNISYIKSSIKRKFDLYIKKSVKI